MSVVYLNNVIPIRRTLKNIGVFEIYREKNGKNKNIKKIKYRNYFVDIIDILFILTI